MRPHRPAAGAFGGRVSTPAAIRFGTAPVHWHNDDLAGWRPIVAFRIMLAEAAAAGSSGIEYGPTFPADLCFDTGRYAYGSDPTGFIREHGDRIGYLHPKDADPDVLASARRAHLGVLDALRRYIFCESGVGVVRIPGAIDALRECGFAGLVIVEQDASRRPAAESAAASLCEGSQRTLVSRRSETHRIEG